MPRSAQGDVLGSTTLEARLRMRSVVQKLAVVELTKQHQRTSELLHSRLSIGPGAIPSLLVSHGFNEKINYPNSLSHDPQKPVHLETCD